MQLPHCDDVHVLQESHSTGVVYNETAMLSQTFHQFLYTISM